MALAAIRHRRRSIAVMARPAELAFIHIIHRHLALRLFHVEQFWMTLFTGKHASVKPVAERHLAHALGLILQLFVKIGQLMTS